MSRHATNLHLFNPGAVVIRLMDRRRNHLATVTPLAPPADIPRDQAEQIAASIPSQPMRSTVDRGKHVDDVTATFLAWSPPGKFFCDTDCGERAVHIGASLTPGGTPQRWCSNCRPRGILGVVDGGNGDAA